MNIFSLLPIELIRYHILPYTGTIKYRENGNYYANQLSKEDPRFLLLSNLSKIESDVYSEVYDRTFPEQFSKRVALNNNYILLVYNLRHPTIYTDPVGSIHYFLHRSSKNQSHSYNDQIGNSMYIKNK